jgi:GT2 family glycosyltransferase
MISQNAPALTVISVLYGPSKEVVRRLSTCLASRPESVEVLLVDHTPTEREVNPRDFDDRVFWIRNPSNPGFGAGCNQAAAQASAPVLFFLNPDCDFEPAMWAALLSEAAKTALEPKRIVQPLVLRRRDGCVDTFGELLLMGFGVVKLAEGRTHSSVISEFQEFTRAAASGCVGPSGAAFLISRAAFDEVGGFWAPFFLLHEDTDLAFRLVHKGFRVSLAPNLVIRHDVSHSVELLNENKTYLAVRNYFWDLFRNCSWLEALVYSPFILMQSALLLGFHAWKHHAPATWRGFWDGLRGLPVCRQSSTRRAFRINRLAWPWTPWAQKFHRVRNETRRVTATQENP